mmetsp:Transcript_31249/g.81926  ORF Transcript_31249/g.81926 Transcript_31249/m.81926 type:complete len:446 (+) Transcript_31249:229-1566(+)
MSDDDFMCDSDEDAFDENDFNTESEGEGDVDIENTYYTAKQYKEDDPDEALSGFAKVVELEEPKGDWGFRALKQTMKVNFRLGKHTDVMETYKEVLTYIDSAVAKNYSEKSINNLMDLISTGPMEVAEQFFQMTLEKLRHRDSRTDRLTFKAKMKLGKLYLDHQRFGPLTKTIRQLEDTCKTDAGEDDMKKANQLFEIFSLKFPMLTAQRANKELKKEYNRALTIKAAIPHPLIMGIIEECGGKMYLDEENWDAAYKCFFDAFKNYDEAGSPRRINCLKMLVIASMLDKSQIDPFAAQEAGPYRDHPECAAMTSLVVAYQANKIYDFEKILRRNRKTLLDDPYMQEYIADLRTNIRTEFLINLIKPYTRVRIPFMADKLHIEADEVEHLLKICILDGTIRGRIDQVQQLLVLTKSAAGEQRYEAIDKWSSQLSNLMKSVSTKLAP